MKILIINNGTKHLTALKNMLKRNSLKVEEFNQIHPPIEGFDLVILSGSSWYSVEESPEKYAKEVLIIKEYKTPIIGICLGCELIAYVFRATLEKLPEREHGIIKIKMTDNEFNAKDNTFSAYEAHEWAIKKIPNNLTAYAKSKDGFEIIKVKNENIWGLQFHPEMLRGTIKGYDIFSQIVSKIQNP